MQIADKVAPVPSFPAFEGMRIGLPIALLMWALILLAVLG